MPPTPTIAQPHHGSAAKIDTVGVALAVAVVIGNGDPDWSSEIDVDGNAVVSPVLSLDIVMPGPEIGPESTSAGGAIGAAGVVVSAGVFGTPLTGTGSDVDLLVGVSACGGCTSGRATIVRKTGIARAIGVGSNWAGATGRRAAGAISLALRIIGA
jgi:hypothetical protein